MSEKPAEMTSDEQMEFAQILRRTWKDWMETAQVYFEDAVLAAKLDVAVFEACDLIESQAEQLKRKTESKPKLSPVLAKARRKAAEEAGPILNQKEQLLNIHADCSRLDSKWAWNYQQRIKQYRLIESQAEQLAAKDKYIRAAVTMIGKCLWNPALEQVKVRLEQALKGE